MAHYRMEFIVPVQHLHLFMYFKLVKLYYGQLSFFEIDVVLFL